MAPIAKAFEKLAAATDRIEFTAPGLGMMRTREMSVVNPSMVVWDAWGACDAVLLEQ
jgi:hypothetical protein